MIEENKCKTSNEMNPDCVMLAQFLTLFQTKYRSESQQHPDPRVRIISWKSIDRAIRVKCVEEEIERKRNALSVGMNPLESNEQKEVAKSSSKGGGAGSSKSRRKSSSSKKRRSLTDVKVKDLNEASASTSINSSDVGRKSPRDEAIDTVAKEVFLEEATSYIHGENDIHCHMSGNFIRSDISSTVNLLDAFEVWSTVALASSVYSSSINTLNLPLHWPQSVDAQEWDTNGLLPNEFSWREFARIAILGIFCLNNGYLMELEDNFVGPKMSAPEIHSLWVKAQRSPISRRQLLSCFRYIRKGNAEKITKSNGKIMNFEATFIGMQELTRKAMNPNDALIVDLVIHRMISNAQLIQYDIAFETTNSSSNKKKGNDKGRSNNECDEFKSSAIKLYWWFVRRNSNPGLKPIFLSDEVTLTIPQSVYPINEGETFRSIEKKIKSGKLRGLEDVKSSILSLLELYLTSAQDNCKTDFANAIIDCNNLFRQEYLNISARLRITSPFESNACLFCSSSDSDCGAIQPVHEISEHPYLTTFATEDDVKFEALTWNDFCVEMVKESKDERWGMRLMETELCSENMARILSGRWITEGFNKEKFPLALDRTGLVVRNILTDSIAHKSGLVVGDVITQVEHIATNNQVKEEQCFESPSDCLNILNTGPDQLKLHVSRSTSNYIESTYDFIQSLSNKYAISCVFDDVDNLHELSTCSQCRNNEVTVLSKLDAPTEAKACLSIIRELGIEWCSLPFHGDHFTQLGHISGLERLDNIMCCIVEDREKSDAFKVHDTEITWAIALKGKPLELVYYGINRLLSIENKKDSSHEIKRKAFANTFIKLLKARFLYSKGILDYYHDDHGPWCQSLACSDNKKALRTSSNDNDELNMRTWLSYIGSSIIRLSEDETDSSLHSFSYGQNAIEYVVATFKPGKGIKSEEGGTFCAIPVHSCLELKDSPLAVGDGDVEKVTGSIFLQFSELIKSLRETEEIRLSIDKAVMNLDSSDEVDDKKCNISFVMRHLSESDYLDKPCNDINQSKQARLSEMLTLVDCLCLVGSSPVSEYLDDVIKSRDSQRPLSSQQSIRPSQYAQCPELDSDVGEHDVEDNDDVMQEGEFQENQNDMEHDVIDITDSPQTSDHEATSGNMNFKRSNENSPLKSQNVTYKKARKTFETQQISTNSSSPAKTAHEVGDVPNQNRTFSIQQLYAPGLPGSMFTWAETVVMMEASLRGQPVLGMRLLSPRYNMAYVRTHFATVIEPYLHLNIRSCPRLEEEHWKAIIVADYKRSLHETGPVILKESGYSYRNPHLVLPIDRVLENVMVANDVQKHPLLETLSQIRGVPSLKDYETNTKALTKKSKNEIEVEAPPGTNPETSSSVINNAALSSEVGRNSINDPIAYTDQKRDESQEMMVEASPAAASPVVEGEGDCVDFTEDVETYKVSAPSNVDVSRIRGGGGDPSESLHHYPRDKWIGKAVYGKCVTTLADNTETGEAIFLGTIVTVNENEKCCNVKVVFVNTSGQLPQPVITPVLWDVLKVVVNPEEMRTLLRVGVDVSGEKETTISHEPANPQYSTEHNSLFAKEVPHYARLKYGLHRSRADISLNKAGLMFLNRLIHRPSSSAPIGVLPDGTSVCWFQSDPKAIYLKKHSMNSREFQQNQKRFFSFVNRWVSKKPKQRYISNEFRENSYYCMWGCTTKSREFLCFEKRDELDEHVAECHLFSKNREEACQGLIRVQEGDQICSLCADITSACCALNIDLARFATVYEDEQVLKSGSLIFRSPFPARVMFKPNSVMDLTDAGRGALHFSNMAFLLSKTDVGLRRLIRLWSRLCRLFCIETDGKFRVPLSKCIIDPNDKMYARKNPDAMYIEDDQNVTDQSVEFTESKFEENQIISSDDLNPPRKPRSLLTQSLNPKEEMKMDIFHTRFDNLKIFLLNLAANIPVDLKLSDSIWDEPYLDRWKRFVQTSHNTLMLIQGLILLQHSVDNLLLPKWWNKGRGWCSAGGAMSDVKTVSIFALRLFAFDAAIYEYYIANSKLISKAKVSSDNKRETRSDRHIRKEKSSLGNSKSEISQDDKPKAPERYALNMKQMLEDLDKQKVKASLQRLMKMKLKKRVSVISDMAVRCAIPRFEGLSGDSCRVCSAGGDLLCCEYCNQVQHMECCSPPLKTFPDFDFICDDCVQDINVTNLHAITYPN